MNVINFNKIFDRTHNKVVVSSIVTPLTAENLTTCSLKVLRQIYCTI